MITLREFAKQSACLGAYMSKMDNRPKAHKKKAKKLGEYLQKRAEYRIISSRSKRLPYGAKVVTSKTKRKY